MSCYNCVLCSLETPPPNLIGYVKCKDSDIWVDPESGICIADVMNTVKKETGEKIKKYLEAIQRIKEEEN